MDNFDGEEGIETAEGAYDSEGDEVFMIYVPDKRK